MHRSHLLLFPSKAFHFPNSCVGLEFDLNDSLKSTITNAQAEHTKRAEAIRFATVEYPRLNRKAIKAAALSPDAVMQLAIQVAFHRTYGEFVPTYEVR